MPNAANCMKTMIPACNPTPSTNAHHLERRPPQISTTIAS